MNLHRSPRLLLLLVLTVVSIVGTMVAAERSASTMASAAEAFLESLTPDQRAQATFTMELDCYRRVPAKLQEEIVSERLETKKPGAGAHYSTSV